jgi:hypothetical protein
MELGKRFEVAFELAGKRAPDVSRETGVPVASINALIRRNSKRSEFTEQILSALPPHLVNHDWVRTGRGSAAPDKKPAAKVQAQVVQAPAPAPVPVPVPVPTVARSVDQVVVYEASTLIHSWEHREELPAGIACVLIPKLGVVRDSDGAGRESAKTVLLVQDVQAFRAEWIRQGKLKPAALAWLQVRDDSMEPILFPGDCCVIDTLSTDVADGRVYAVYYGGQERLRRLFTLPGGKLRIAPASPDFAAIDLSAEDVKAVKIIGRVVHRDGRGGL